mgnify:CR=1 FL=1
MAAGGLILNWHVNLPAAIIDDLKRVVCDTVRSVLELTAEELERRTDLEKETIAEVRRILTEEFGKE